jgi:hypothetical protein
MGDRDKVMDLESFGKRWKQQEDSFSINQPSSAEPGGPAELVMKVTPKVRLKDPDQ